MRSAVWNCSGYKFSCKTYYCSGNKTYCRTFWSIWNWESNFINIFYWKCRCSYSILLFKFNWNRILFIQKKFRFNLSLLVKVILASLVLKAFSSLTNSLLVFSFVKKYSDLHEDINNIRRNRIITLTFLKVFLFISLNLIWRNRDYWVNCFN